MSYRLFILFLSVALWIANGIYAVYVNKLRLEQYKLVHQLRDIKRENNELYWAISRYLNYQRGKEYATQKGFVPVKPYRVVNFFPTLEGKPLIDFYFVWFGDTPSKIAEKLGIPLKELIEYNPSLRWGYVIPGQRLIYPVSFPYAEKPKEQDNQTEENGNKTHNLVPGQSYPRQGRGNAP